MILDRYTTITIGTGNNALVISPTSENDVGIASGSLMLDQKIVDGDLEFGRLMSSEFSAQLFNTNQDFQGEQITADVTEDNVTTRIFTGVIESSKQDWSNTYRDIIAYDWIYYHREDNIASWWNSFWVSTRTQATVKQIRDSLLTYMGFSALSDTYINDSQIIKNEFQQFTNIKFETIFKMLCEIQLTIPHIKGDGSFELITFGTTTTDISGMYEGSNSEWEDFTTQQITGIGIYDTSSNMVQLVGTNTNVLNIAGNLFLLNMSASQLTTIGNNMLTALTDFTFVPASVKMILSDFSLSLGKKVSTDVGNTYVMQNTYSGSLLVEQTIKGVAYSDVLNGNVPSINDDLITANKIAVVQHDIDGLSTEFGRLETNLENNYSTTTEMNSAIEQSAEGIRTEVSQTYVNQTTYNAEVQRLQDEIDGAIESYTGSAVPTLNNYPANEWTTATERDKHLGDLYLVNASGGSYAGFYYRFDKSSSTYSWVHIPDNEVQKALADAAEANQKAEAAQATADGIADDLSDNYSTTQQMNSAINQKADEITQTVSTTYETKSDATNKLNTANTNAQGYATQAKNEANASTDTKLTNYYTKTQTDSAITQKANEITLNVSENYTTKTEFGNLEIGGTNLITNTSFDTTKILTGALNPTSKGFSYYGLWAAQIIFTSWLRANIKPLTNYIISFDYEVIAIESGITDARSQGIMYGTNMGTSWTIENPVANRVVGFKRHCEQAWTTGDNVSSAIIYWYGFYSDSNHRATLDTIRITNLKLEEGNKATDWSPAPEDLDANAQGYANTALSTANTNAQGYANTAQTNAVNTAKSYTDAQLQITSSSILSTVEQGYTTKTEFNNLSIGGENVLEYSKNFELVNTYIMTQQGAVTTNAEGFTEAEQRGNGNSWIENYMRLYLDATDKGLVGKDITISIDFKTNDISKIENMFCSWGSQDASGTRVGDINIGLNSYKTVDGSALANNKWTRIYYTFRVETIANNSRYYIIQFKINNAIPSGTSMYYRKPKVEIGNRPTDWSPALYDIQPVGTNLLRYAPKSKTPTSYLALSLNLTEKLVKGQTYTLQLWDIDISHTGKQASELNVSVYAGGGNNVLTTITGFTNGHADYKVATFTVSSDSQLDNLWLNIYNSVPNASGTLNLTIGRWKLEKGNRATEWQMNPIDASSKSEVQQLANMVAIKVNSSGRLVTAALGVDPDTSTSYVKVKADDIDIISNGNIQLTGKSIGITSTNFSVTPAGSITAKAGTIGGWSIDSEKLYKSGTISGTTYASYLKANELKISAGPSTLGELEQAIIRSGYIQLVGQAGNAMKNIIIDGAGEESPGTGIGYIRTPRLVTSLIEPQVDNEVSIAGALLCNSNGKVSTTSDITSGGELISGYGMELGMASANAAALIDFHWASNNTDFTARIWQRGENTVDLIGKNSSTWGIWRAASFNSQSSKYVKKNIKDVTEKEARNILKLRPVKFDYKNSDLTNQRGLIAEEVLEIMPEMVNVPKDYTGFNKNEPWNTPSIDYSKFVPYLIKMIQIQQKDIDALKNK